MTREQALIKIRKLRALAASPNEHEAELAARRADELEEQYGIVELLIVSFSDLRKMIEAVGQMAKAANQMARAMREFDQDLDRASSTQRTSRRTQG